MSLPFASLDAATSTGPGVAKDLEGSFGKHTIAVSDTGGSTFSVKFEGSHDNSIWFTIVGIISGASVTTVDGNLYRYVRANLEVLTGGSSPTVTATIASA